MADAIYPACKELMLTNQFDWLTDPIVAVLVGTSNYTYSQFHATLADVPPAARVAVSGTLTGRTVSSGIVDANDTQFGSTIGNPVNAVILCSYTGSDLLSPLVAYLDQAASGLPLNPNGQPILITWSNGASKIFSL
jgi:hypothetical protein